jgi:serine/threonine protein kinase
MLAGQRFGRYEVHTKLGEGGMGEVYTALDSELGRSVAIKLLPSEFSTDDDRRSRFRQEARVISALNHPNIITIYEIGENELGSFLATEFVEGRTLRDVIKNESLTLTRILKIIEQAANALVAAHAAGIVHRDIKPENIMLRRDGIVKVLDFGLAKPKNPVIPMGDGDTSKTVPGTVMGSARYMSPEQARGLETDERTDIWSLGIVMYEMLTGHAPFEGETTADTLASVIYKEPEPISHVLPNLPFELQRILRKALQKDREERYQDIKDLSLDIKSLLFDLEHAEGAEHNSGGHVISSPQFSENPTIIHRTISANHPTDQTNVYTIGPDDHSQIRPKPRLMKYGSYAVLGFLFLAVVGFGYLTWNKGGEALSASAFAKTQISRINTDGKATAPAISPDGRYVAFVSGDPGAKSLVVKQISTDSSVTVVPSTNLNLANVSFSPEGDYVYYCETRSDGSVNTLYRVPTLGGTPKRLIEDVDGAVTFSPDGKQFAFIRHATSNGADNILIADSNTLEIHPLMSTKDTDYDFFSFRIAWSPDGKKILLGAGKRQGGFVARTDIVEADIADKSVRRLNENDLFSANNFAWLDDGSGFLFVGRETQNAPAQVWRASYPAAEMHQVTNDFNDYVDLSISADGRKLVTVKGDTSSSIWRFTPSTKTLVQVTDESRNLEGLQGLVERPDKSLLFTRTEAKQSQIWAADSDGKSARAILADQGFSVSPVVTPDGRYIVFNLQKEKDRSSRIWRADADGKNEIGLTGENPEHADFNPQLTPDGKTVIFQRQISNAERSILMKISIDGGEPKVIFSDDKLSAFMPRISPDGKKLAFVTYDIHTFDKRMQIAAFDGDQVGKIENSLEMNLINQFYWSPDGKSLTAMSTRAGTPNIWRLPVDGSAPTPLTDFKSGRILNFSWSSDNKDLLIARGNSNNDLVMIRDSEAAERAALRKSKARSGMIFPQV